MKVEEGDVQGGREHVLIIDDHSGLREIARRILSNKGYRVTMAEDGVEGLSLAREMSTDLDLILTDVIMPNMKGPEMVKILASELGKDAFKVIYCSGYPRDAIENVDELGDGVFFIAKPYSSKGLAVFVRQVLDGDISPG